MRKPLISFILFVLMILVSFSSFAESEVTNGPFHMRLIAKGETTEDYKSNGLLRALLVYYAGLSLNMDEYSSNNINLTDITNKYEISFNANSAFITFNTFDSYVLVFFMPNSEESFFSVYPEESPGVSALIQELTDETYKINMQDFADAIDALDQHIKQNSK